MLARRVPIFLVALALVACSGAKVKPQLTYKNSYASYERIAANWTRAGKVYKNFGTRSLVTATYFSLPMRRAFAAEWSRAYDLPDAERKNVLANQLADGEQRVEFVLSFYTPQPTHNDLDKNGSSWRLWFIDANGAKVEAARVQRLRVRHEKEYLFFPHLDRWSRLYRVYFPIQGPDGQQLVTEQGTVTLRVTGIEGVADLVWDIPPGAH